MSRKHGQTARHTHIRLRLVADTLYRRNTRHYIQEQGRGVHGGLTEYMEQLQRGALTLIVPLSHSSRVRVCGVGGAFSVSDQRSHHCTRVLGIGGMCSQRRTRTALRDVLAM